MFFASDISRGALWAGLIAGAQWDMVMRMPSSKKPLIRRLTHKRFWRRDAGAFLILENGEILKMGINKGGIVVAMITLRFL